MLAADERTGTGGGWRGHPAHLLDAALRRLAPRLAPAAAAGARVARHPGDARTDPGYRLDRPGWRVDGVTVGLALRWRSAELLDPAGVTWPYVGIVVEGGGPRRLEVEQRLPGELRVEAAALGWHLSDHGWPWWRWIRPAPAAVASGTAAPGTVAPGTVESAAAALAEVDASGLAADCAAALLAGWAALAGPLDDAVRRRRAT